MTELLFVLLNKIESEFKEFKLIIREDGSGSIDDLDGNCLYGFDTLSELVYKYFNRYFENET